MRRVGIFLITWVMASILIALFIPKKDRQRKEVTRSIQLAAGLFALGVALL